MRLMFAVYALLQIYMHMHNVDENTPLSMCMCAEHR